MAFTGVNKANVAVTDTFDTWRIRTNEVNTTLNLAVSANTADTLVYRDNVGSANLNILNANTTVVLIQELLILQFQLFLLSLHILGDRMHLF